MNRPRIIFYRSPDADPRSAAKWEEFKANVPWRIVDRGHECVVYSQETLGLSDQPGLTFKEDPEWDLPGVWFFIDSDDSSGRLAHIGVTQAYMCLQLSDKLHLPPATWDRQASLMTVNCYDMFPGIVESTFRGHTYKHMHHFVFGHKGEAESRHDWLVVDKKDLFLDIGCSLGSWTLPAAACGAEVHSFDPGTDLFSLCKHIRLNGFGDRVTPVPELVSDTPGQVVARDQIPWHCVVSDQVLGPAMTTTIDEYAHLRKITPTFIKIDVDGLEMKVLAGGRKTLETAKPRLVVEVHDFLGVDGKEVVGFLESLGYNCVTTPKECGYYSHVYASPK